MKNIGMKQRGQFIQASTMKKVMKFTAISLITTSVLVQTVSVGAKSFENKYNNNSYLCKDKEKSIKNVIFMISDGWGKNQILATDYFMDGKSGTQIYEKFPTQLYMSTYSYGSQGIEDDHLGIYNPLKNWSDFNYCKSYAADSAAAGTAMSTGTKTYDAAIGLDQNQTALKHLTEDFEEMGRSTGVVSTVQISHATPASFVAHNVSRNNYSEIAQEMILSSATDVIMGAGNPLYDDNGDLRSEVLSKHYNYVGGESTWNGLLDGTLGNDADADGDTDLWNLIQTKEEFLELQCGETPSRVIGIPQVHSTLQQARKGDALAGAYQVPQNQNVPSLAVMSKGALNVLDNDKDGFFLMIEGGAVDWTGHANQSGRMIEEQEDFNKAVDEVCKWVKKNSNWNETLVIVTGDHETGYLTGSIGTNDCVINNGKGNMPTMNWNSGSHTNQLIPFYAKGKGSYLLKYFADQKDPVRGKYLDNTEIALAIRHYLNNSN